MVCCCTGSDGYQSTNLCDGWNPSPSVFFHKTKAEWGQFSNMAGGMPMRIGEILVPSSEHLYQALRFPDDHAAQQRLIEVARPLQCKWRCRGLLRQQTGRLDWSYTKLHIMRVCLRIKLAQYWDVLMPLLRATGTRPIVEFSVKDRYWGAQPVADHLVGANHLGWLWMELRA